ncbi:MAG: MotE family protein [Lachnospiraceae bacterium]
MAEEKEVAKSKAELIQEKAAKKAEKVAAKEAKRREKLIKKGIDPDDPDFEDDGGIGGKVAVFLATVIIIAIWLGILVLVIKWDVGGFGSTVMYPILKDVPYVNKILPEVEVPIEQQQYPYTTLSEATEYVKQLERQLAETQEKVNKKNDRIKELKAQLEKLSVYEEKEAEFEQLKQKFDEEVVFSDNAPDISNYQEYYEAIDPANAQVIYRQVLEQQKKNKETEDYVATYASMKPKKAAAVFDTMMDDNSKLVADILGAMDTQSRANILAEMNAENAAIITAILEP